MNTCTSTLLVVGSLLVQPALCQTMRVNDPNANLWVSHWGDHRFHSRWSFHTEFHIRRAELGASWQQLLLRPAVNYHLNPDVMFTLGYSYYYNYPYGGYPIPFGSWENNLFQQVQVGQRIGRTRITHRFRMEERFLAKVSASPSDPEVGDFNGYAYQNRFRYRVWLSVPLGDHDQNEPGVVSFNFYDEVFLNFGNSTQLDFIQQNRISTLLGYQFTKPFSILFGYLYQTIQRPGSANGADLMELNSTIHLVLVYNLDGQRK